MGIVYRAEDSQLGRTVALKFLPVELDDAVPQARERFFREARAASALDHPRICTIYEIGEADDGRPFIAMAYCAGETLGERIRNGPVPIDEARAITIQIAEGLMAAHHAGVIHRDVKPANIMLTPGGVKILDFGLAKLSNVTQMTQTGATLGTPAYMSPEQATGGTVDARSDIWSLGVILYEMVTGTRAFPGDNPTAIMYAILSNEVRPVAELRADVSPELELVIRKCLEREPSARYQNLGELLVDLGVDEQTLVLGSSGLDMARTQVSGQPAARTQGKSSPATGRWKLGMIAGLVAVAALVAGLLVSHYASLPGQEGAPLAEVETATEMPAHVVGITAFANRTGQSKYDWYGDGIARLVSDALAGSRMLHVVSGAKVEQLQSASNNEQELLAAASSAGMDTLITGEIMPSSTGVTVATRILETATGRSVSARRVDGLTPDSLLGCVDEIAAEARKGLGLPPEDTVNVFSADFVVDSPDAYRAYLSGLTAWANWHYDEAEKGFTEAIVLAPDFTMAHYRLAWVFIATGRREEALTEIRRAAADVGRLSDREARYVRAAQADFESRLDEAVAEYRALVEAYPYDADARHMLAGVLHDSGRYDEEIEQLEMLARLDPNDSVVRSMLGYAHLAKGDFTGAVTELQRYVELEPGSANGHTSLGDAYRAQGELELAAEEYRTALISDSNFHVATVNLALVDALQGRYGDAETRLRLLVEDPLASPKHRLDAAFELASVLRCRGRFSEAQDVLATLEPELEAEQVREAMALSVRGSCYAELGDSRAARRLIDRAIDRSPGVPTRYLFTRGLLELQSGDLESVLKTAASAAAGALPPEDPDRTEEKVAAYLEGMAALAEGRAEEAIERLSWAVAAGGYQYSIYRLGLAHAFLSAGRLPEAMAAARQASEPGNPFDPRLDLELDRVRARLVLAQVWQAMERPDKAANEAREFLSDWRSADRGLPDLEAAKKLAGDPS